MEPYKYSSSDPEDEFQRPYLIHPTKRRSSPHTSRPPSRIPIPVRKLHISTGESIPEEPAPAQTQSSNTFIFFLQPPTPPTSPITASPSSANFESAGGPSTERQTEKEVTDTSKQPTSENQFLTVGKHTSKRRSVGPSQQNR